jgi:hypothetical protein
MMKIQNRSSVLNTGIWKISEMSQAQETQNALPTSQTEPVSKLLTETQRNQRVSEFRAQEQLVRASVKQQVQETFHFTDEYGARF